MYLRHKTETGAEYITDDQFVEDHLGKIPMKVEIVEEIIAERDTLIEEKDRYKAALEKITCYGLLGSLGEYNHICVLKNIAYEALNDRKSDSLFTGRVENRL